MQWRIKILEQAKKRILSIFKIKYRSIGIRVVYTLVLKEQLMNIVVISERDDNFCYDMAAKLYKIYGEKLFENIFDDFGL